MSPKGEGQPGTVIVGKAHGDDAPCWLLFSFGESGTTRPTKGRFGWVLFLFGEPAQVVSAKLG